jgi:hypothetical protein
VGGGGAPIVVDALRSNCKLTCAIGDSQQGQEPLSTEAERSTEAVTRQLVKTKQTEKT